MSNLNGLPLLSGPPPAPSTSRAQNACRKCNKEFIIIFTRSTRCNHCGYLYCSSCADYQALMPRHGAASGYDQVHVCAFCIEFLNITASSRNQLKSLPLSDLRRYVNAYDIPVKGPIDKNDLVDAIIAVKTPTGTLPPSNESHYRAHGVPKHRSSRPRGLFSTRPPPPTHQQTFTPPPPDFPRPDLDPEPAPYRTYTSNTTRQRQTPPTPPPPQPSSPQPQPRFRTASQPQTPPRSAPHSTPRPSPASTASPPPTRPPTAPRSPPQPSTPQPPPPLSALLAMSYSSLSRLSIHTLKQILYEARVRLPADLLEKEQLVARVSAWLEEERTAAEERDIMEREEREQEERERRERQEQEERERDEAERPIVETEPAESEDAHTHGSAENVETHDESQQHPPPPSTSPSPPLPRTTPAERSGLCVICQDQEANIAIVDCGHLAMCRACSDLVLASSRECPLCRTRIVTEARLLRIFKT
ncbi:uncharacterized protein F5147DRAFT_672308 [Suillus discolor]|uniref:RING-type domain-containing protein n=1 Tax=Suillus discolor TaxID=1912936 RepID=A0A9P7JZ90_9AGAM|nr:uncharacterized protein F5147DRAFT_672308 [Suillus discolor]KAG2117323.1 hypothetical protein F5147DRAFT_672308 [Suillus discolor]